MKKTSKKLSVLCSAAAALALAGTLTFTSFASSVPANDSDVAEEETTPAPETKTRHKIRTGTERQDASQEGKDTANNAKRKKPCARKGKTEKTGENAAEEGTEQKFRRKPSESGTTAAEGETFKRAPRSGKKGTAADDAAENDGGTAAKPAHKHGKGGKKTADSVTESGDTGTSNT